LRRKLVCGGCCLLAVDLEVLGFGAPTEVMVFRVLCGSVLGGKGPFGAQDMIDIR
ncbi:hypothetical protein A2U01_0098866, partial [Trifolium medium]|nr:hypothetical protein [Trifolium medium]